MAQYESRLNMHTNVPRYQLRLGFGSVSLSIGLLVTEEWLCAVEDEISLHHPDTQEGRHGYD